MKNCSLLVTLIVCCALGLISSPLYSQVMTAQQLDAIVKPNLAQCQLMSGSKRLDPAFIIPFPKEREFPMARIAKTLHGIWQGRVIGDNSDESIDYFWIVDTKNSEGLIVALRNGKQSVDEPQQAANVPKLTFLMCPHQGYVPSTQSPMVHEFVKVADSVEDAPRILQKATGVKFQKAQPTLSDLWQEIVASGYFKSMPAAAFVGALFKPLQLGQVPSEVGPAQVSLKGNGEYFGGGLTAIKFTPGVPIKDVEYTQFIGTTTKSGDYLVASAGNGKLWKVESVGGEYELAIDSVVLGPLK